MCTFVSLILRCDRVEAVNGVLARTNTRQRQRHVEQVKPSLLRAVMAADENEFTFTSPACDCGTYLGSAVYVAPSPEEGLKAARERYRRKGWSEAKIERALFSKSDASARLGRHLIPNEDSAYWVSLLSGIMTGLSLPTVGVMHHFYSKSPGIETIAPSRKIGGQIDTAADALSKMQDGTIYDFTT